MNVRIAAHYLRPASGSNAAPLVYDPDLPHASGYWYLSSVRFPGLIGEFDAFMASNAKEIDDLKRQYQFQ